ncbi:MAG: helix-turn-helix domain-containing protein [Alteraurantiacibacter sp.]
MDRHLDLQESGDQRTQQVNILRAADRARSALRGSRSDRLMVLFDYLLASSLSGNAVSEQEIAENVFGDDVAGRPGHDANIRVYVHRLRKILETVFADSTIPGLYIPVGEYRLVPVGGAAEAPTQEPQVQHFRGTPYLSGGRLAGLVVLALGGATAIWLWLAQPPPLANTIIWQPFERSERPRLVVVGDYYLFARLNPSTEQGAAPELVWDETVPTREDLTILQMLDPGQAHTVVDYNQQFVTGGTIEALGIVRQGLAQLSATQRQPTRLVAASQLTPEMLKAHDIIYVGLLGGMSPLLHDPLAQASGFRIDPGFGGLTDIANSRQYNADNMVLTDERISRRDYAYVASVPGPDGNRLLIIAGLGDAGLKEAAQMIVDAQQMTRLGRDPARSRTGFEALFRVRTIGSVNVSGTLVLDRPLRSTPIWDDSGHVRPYRPLGAAVTASPQP